VHVVLAGDLDATLDAASVRFWRGRQSLGGMSVCYRDAWGSTHPDEPGHTFTAENPLVTAENWDWELELGRRIDHVFVRCTDHGPTLDIHDCERIFDEPVDGVWGRRPLRRGRRPFGPDLQRTTGALTALRALMRQGELAECPTDCLAQPHPRPPPLHPAAQGALHVR
jgi:hypothetical protein